MNTSTAIINNRPYQCDFCHKSFYRLEHKVRHHRVHTREKPYICNYSQCDKKFARSDELSRHVKIHSQPPSILLQRKRKIRKFNYGSSSSKSTTTNNNNNSKLKSMDDEEAYLKQQQHCSILRFIQPSLMNHNKLTTNNKSTTTNKQRSSPYKQSLNSKLNHCPAPNCFKSFWRKGQLARHVEKQHNVLLSLEELDDQVRLSALFNNNLQVVKQEEDEEEELPLSPSLSLPCSLSSIEEEELTAAAAVCTNTTTTTTTTTTINYSSSSNIIINTTQHIVYLPPLLEIKKNNNDNPVIWDSNRLPSIKSLLFMHND